VRTLEEYLEFFIGELGGISMTPSQFRAWLTEMWEQPDTAAPSENPAPCAGGPGRAGRAAE
jgi:hypothetical protein